MNDELNINDIKYLNGKKIVFVFVGIFNCVSTDFGLLVIALGSKLGISV